MHNFKLKPVTLGDRDLMLEMRNKDFVRMNMLSSALISTAEHMRWFDDMLSSSDKAYFMFEMDDLYVGVIGFFKLNTRNPDWSFYLGQNDLPRGSGTQMCRLGLDWFFLHYADKTLTTTVVSSNNKSLFLHEKLGFRKSKTHDMLALDREGWLKAKLIHN